MTSKFSLLLVSAFLTQVWCQRPPFNPHGFPFDKGLVKSHFCMTNFNELINEKTYPTCPSNTDCDQCDRGAWWEWSWRWSRPSCPSCCDDPVIVSKIVQQTEEVCCPGYYGWRCDKAFCAKPCEDLKTNCIAPNTCGPACNPPCRNGGTCINTELGNVCSCASGWTGPTCETCEFEIRSSAMTRKKTVAKMAARATPDDVSVRLDTEVFSAMKRSSAMTRKKTVAKMAARATPDDVSVRLDTEVFSAMKRSSAMTRKKTVAKMAARATPDDVSVRLDTEVFSAMKIMSYHEKVRKTAGIDVLI
ncbi:hypothetical protein LSH36_235g04037 [Paralvinella palmiformis]|uniref:EGF-like domain-containing protein n=1 Tax=Paralvinella palmiformis TaxID=53620 RepID=A0AAD9JLX7_9ANNE|nr:hypothetical protein LSH36_235g04037 [Paralvinella palmiformis]